MVKINEKKYKNLILFFANKIKNGTLGKLKIMKLMYFLDFDYFEKYGKSISGDEYLRFDNGPIPRMAEKVLKEMSGEELHVTDLDFGGKDIRIIKKKIGLGYNDQQLIEALKNFDVNLFSKEELMMMEETANKWEKFSGADMKNASHGEAPWIATKPNSVIDYNLAYYRNKYGEMANM